MDSFVLKSTSLFNNNNNDSLTFSPFISSTPFSSCDVPKISGLQADQNRLVSTSPFLGLHNSSKAFQHNNLPNNSIDSSTNDNDQNLNHQNVKQTSEELQHDHKNQQLLPSQLLSSNSPYYLVNKTWTMGNRNLLRRLARVSHDNFHPYNRRTVNNIDDASKISADAYSAIQYQGYDWSHKSIDFGQGKKSSYASVSRREFQLKTVSKVIDICGENIPVSVPPISIWSQPQRFAKKAIKYLEKVDAVSDDETDIPNFEEGD
nr:7077_t:CDS:2 [Entrophospora candida]